MAPRPLLLACVYPLFAASAVAQAPAAASPPSATSPAPVSPTTPPAEPTLAAPTPPAPPTATTTPATAAPAAVPATAAPATAPALPYPDCSAPPDNTPPQLVQWIEQQLGPLPVQEIGPSANALLGQLLAQLCEGNAWAQYLPNTCGAAGQFDVNQLRTRLLLDLTSAPLALAPAGSAATLERVALALLASWNGNLEPAQLAQRVAAHLGYAPAGGDALQCSVPQVNPSDALGIGVLLFWRLSQDSAGTLLVGQAEAERIIQQTLIEQQVAVNGQLSETQRQLTSRLASSALHLRQRWQRFKAQQLTHLQAQAVLDLLSAELDTLQAALSLSHVQPVTLPSELLHVAQALAHARVEELLSQLQVWLSARAQLPSETLELARTALRFANARTQAEAERIVRGLLLGLGPWSEDWIASANAGFPQLKSGDFNITADGTLGYNAESWGVITRGGISVFDIESPGYINTTLRAGGNADAWVALNLGRNTDVELRGTFDATVFDTESALSDDDGAVAYVDEESLFVRVGGLLGLRTQAPSWALGAWAGGSFQLESYGNLTHDGSREETQKNENDAMGGAVEVRLRAQWEFLSQLLTLRIALDSKYYTLTRAADSISVTDGVALVALDEQALQLEALGRAFIDIEALRWFGFVPGVGLGLDHYQLAVTGQETAVTTVPSYVVGVRRTVF